VIGVEQAHRDGGARRYYDGIGFDPAKLADTPAGGHVGLLLLQDLARAAGGGLEIDASPGRGTRLQLEVPAR
jgi:signal transduction histidine kinase